MFDFCGSSEEFYQGFFAILVDLTPEGFLKKLLENLLLGFLEVTLEDFYEK